MTWNNRKGEIHDKQGETGQICQCKWAHTFYRGIYLDIESRETDDGNFWEKEM